MIREAIQLTESTSRCRISAQGHFQDASPPVTVPMANVGDYRNATGWNRFSNYIGKYDLTMRAERYYRADEDLTANDAKFIRGRPR